MQREIESEWKKIKSEKEKKKESWVNEASYNSYW